MPASPTAAFAIDRKVVASTSDRPAGGRYITPVPGKFSVLTAAAGTRRGQPRLHRGREVERVESADIFGRFWGLTPRRKRPASSALNHQRASTGREFTPGLNSAVPQRNQRRRDNPFGRWRKVERARTPPARRAHGATIIGCARWLSLFLQRKRVRCTRMEIPHLPIMAWTCRASPLCPFSRLMVCTPAVGAASRRLANWRAMCDALRGKRATSRERDAPRHYPPQKRK